MRATPFWFGPSARPLFGWYHSPPNRAARAGFVLCQPLGRDGLQAHYAIRRLAERLAAAGIAAVRFDYDGTGDSFGTADDADRVQMWLASVAAALDTMRASGCPRIGLVGMRIGATLAAEAAARDGDIDALVLWDPCVSGKAYISEQRALASLTLGIKPSGDDGSVETPGMVFGGDTVSALRTLEIAATGTRLASHALLLTRPERSPSNALLDRLAASNVELAPATGQAELMDVGSPFQVLPDAAIDEIVAWSVAHTDANSFPVESPTRARDVVMGFAPDGSPIVETADELGPQRLFGITTQLPGAIGTPLLLLSVANEHHIGPNRLWVELARRWAAARRPIVRFDLSGLGDSPTRPGQREFVSRALEAFTDVQDVARAVSPADPSDVCLVGLCSAAYQAIESALLLRPRAIVAVNPVLSFQPPEMMAGAPVDARRRACIPRTTLVEKFHADGPLAPLRRRFPELGWTVRNWMARRHRPLVWLRELDDMGVHALFICGDREMRQLRRGMTARAFRSLGASGRLRFEFVPGLDHGLLRADHRVLVTDMMSDFLAALPSRVEPQATVAE
jgi:pimeloyl-ACP methyl ester carboxylesterase